MKWFFSLLSFLLCNSSNPVFSIEIQGDIAVEARLFSEEPLYEDQHRNSGSLSLNLEGFEQITDTVEFNFKTFLRYDSADSTRTYADLRLFNFLYAKESYQLVVGVAKVFWGVAEFVHLVDVINQTDVLESLDGEEKLGQPMVSFSMEKDWGMVEAFLLPFFRKCQFPGKGGRLRGSVIDEEDSEFESSRKERHLDLAFRYSHSKDEFDFGVYQFIGTSRKPLFVEEIEDGSIRLAPYYEQISQTGLDLQFTKGQLLIKLETLYRYSSSDEGIAVVSGFEYTITDIAQSGADLGIIGEHVIDDRNISDNTLYNNDIIAGIRFAANEQNSTEILLGMVWDVETHSKLAIIEASRRIGDSIKIELSGVYLQDIADDDPIIMYQQDSHIRLVGIYYF